MSAIAAAPRRRLRGGGLLARGAQRNGRAVGVPDQDAFTGGCPGQELVQVGLQLVAVDGGGHTGTIPRT